MPRKMPNICKFSQPDDVFVDKEKAQFRSDDIVIPVMGPTGVGKSTVRLMFSPRPEISSELVLSYAESSDGFASCTVVLAAYRVQIPADVAEKYPFTRGRHLVLVDTPGFDTISVSDTEILRRLAVWLASAYDAEMKVAGVVYMYPIFPGRITRNDCANIKVFQKICGERGLSRVILSTTRWKDCLPQTGESREKEIWDSFWKSCSDGPSRLPPMARLEDSPSSAWAIVETILERMNDDGTVVLALQNQLVDKGKTLPQTDAAQELRSKILSMIRDCDADGSEDWKKRLDALAKEAKELKIPFSKRIQGVFGVYR